MTNASPPSWLAVSYPFALELCQQKLGYLIDGGSTNLCSKLEIQPAASLGFANGRYRSADSLGLSHPVPSTIDG